MNNRNVKEEVFGLLLIKEVRLCSKDYSDIEHESMEQWLRGGIMALQSVIKECRLQKEYSKWRNEHGAAYGWKPKYEQELKELL